MHKPDRKIYLKDMSKKVFVDKILEVIGRNYPIIKYRDFLALVHKSTQWKENAGTINFGCLGLCEGRKSVDQYSIVKYSVVLLVQASGELLYYYCYFTVFLPPGLGLVTVV